MDKPNYVLKSLENMREPKDERVSTMKKVVLIIVGVLILGSIVFKANLFGELSWMAQVLLVALFFGVLLSGNNEFVPYPIELRFYDDRIEIIRDHVYYNKHKIRKEIYVFRYADIEECVFNKSASRLKISGRVYVEWYTHDKSGAIPQTPDTSKTDTGLCFFYTNADPSVDFVKEIENHSPIAITVE